MRFLSLGNLGRFWRRLTGRPRTVILVGLLRPFDGERPKGAKIWACNRAYIHQPDADRLFFFDRIETLQNHGHKDFVKHINELGCQITTKWHYPGVPNSEAYPIIEVMKHFNLLRKNWAGEDMRGVLRDGRPYFTSTISYMMALAIYEGFDTIVVHGMQAAPCSFEYYEQKECQSFWLGLAMGQGMRVMVSQDCYLGRPHPWKTPLYGWIEQDHNEFANQMLATAAAAIMRHKPPVFRWSSDTEESVKYPGPIPVVTDEEIKEAQRIAV